jgi:activated CDC42 kinase 1
MIILFLQITELSHFDNDHVRIEDFEKIGMGPPGARRLMDAVKKRRSKMQKDALLKKIMPRKSSTLKNSSKSRSQFHDPLPVLSCIISHEVCPPKFCH